MPVKRVSRSANERRKTRKRFEEETSMSNCNSGGRFLTTACTVAQGLPDDCDELEILRWSRDNWLSRQPGGESAIRHYCEVSPQIVEKINNDSDEPSFFDILYHQMILPSVSL